MIKCKSKLYYLFSVVLVLYFALSPISSIGLHAESTSSGIEGAFEYTEDYVRDNFDAICRYVSRWYAIISDGIIGTWNDFEDWLDSSGNGDVWEQHPHSPIRQVNGVETEVEVPQEVQQIILNYIQYRIQQNPATYTECYISSYKYLDTSWIGSYGNYASIKEAIKQSGGYGLICAGGNVNYNNWCYLITIPKETFELGFYGTTLSGTFTNVQLEHQWNNLQSIPIGSYGIKLYTFQPNSNNFQQLNNWGESNARREISVTGVKNNTSYQQANGYTSQWTILSNTDKDELVYVFSTLNALKAFNSGSPQPYYLTSDGLQNSNWTVGSGTINTGTLSSSNSTYNSVVNNVQSGWTADEVLALVDKIATLSGNGGSSNDDNDNSKWWEKVGDSIGNLIDGLIEVLSTIIEKLSDALLSIIHLLTGYTDDNGVVHEGLFTKLTALVNSGFNSFISSIFSWLPEEIITLLTATLVFGIFFGIFKMLRR